MLEVRDREREREQREDLFIRCLVVYLFIGLLFGQRAVDAQFLESFLTIVEFVLPFPQTHKKP